MAPPPDRDAEAMTSSCGSAASLALRDLDPALVAHAAQARAADRGTERHVSLSRSSRNVPETNAADDARGEPIGRFVVLAPG